LSNSGSIRIRVGGVYIQGNQILLVQHQKNGQEYWLLPGGGVEFGETAAAALERELVEETGLQTRSGKLLFINESIPPDQHRHILNITLLGQVLGGKLIVGEDFGVLKDVRWVEKEDFEKVKFYPEFKDELLRQWQAGFGVPAGSLGNLWKD
jgi:ADP-ribose pyrophosphatase YjhB (NUDIX family)